jgi:hypothetical protein
LRYRSYKLVGEGEECNLIVQVARMVLNARGWKRAWNEKTTLNGIDNVKCHWLLHIVSIPNGHMLINGEHDWHIPFGGSTSLYATKLDLV